MRERMGKGRLAARVDEEVCGGERDQRAREVAVLRRVAGEQAARRAAPRAEAPRRPRARCASLESPRRRASSSTMRLAISGWRVLRSFSGSPRSARATTPSMCRASVACASAGSMGAEWTTEVPSRSRASSSALRALVIRRSYRPGASGGRDRHRRRQDTRAGNLGPHSSERRCAGATDLMGRYGKRRSRPELVIRQSRLVGDPLGLCVLRPN